MNTFPEPAVLKCMYFRAPSPGWQTRSVNDYEFDLYTGSERDMYIDDQFYKIGKGSLVFRKPGQTVTAIGDYDAYMITLDFSGENTIPPELYHRGFAPTKPLVNSNLFDRIPEVFVPAHYEELVSLLKQIAGCSYPNVIDPDLQKSCAAEFLFLVLSDAVRYTRKSATLQTENHNYIEKACRYIDKHYALPISIDDLAQHTALNGNYLIRLFRNTLGTTPNRYIIDTRLYRARDMTIQTTLSIKAIAASCGFSTPAYFIKCFREKYGFTPGEYRAIYSNIHAHRS